MLFEWNFYWVGIIVNKRQQTDSSANSIRLSVNFGFRVPEKDSGYSLWLWFMLDIVFFQSRDSKLSEKLGVIFQSRGC